MTLKWTKEKPTKNGWYWYKKEEHESIVVFVRLGRVFKIYSQYARGVEGMSGRWAGPLQEADIETDEIK